MDLIKRRLDKGLYKRIDTFQEDIFACLDRARRLSRTDSQVFEDSIELQSFFIKKRDEMCKGVLTSPALSYTAMHLSASVEAIRQTKLLQEEQEQEQENEMASTHGESMTIDQKVYTPGDFVYYDVPENKCKNFHSHSFYASEYNIYKQFNKFQCLELFTLNVFGQTMKASK